MSPRDPTQSRLVTIAITLLLAAPSAMTAELGFVVSSLTDIAGGYCKKCVTGGNPVPGTCMNSSKATGVFCPPCPAVNTCGVALSDSSTFTLSTDHTIKSRLLDDGGVAVTNKTIDIYLPTEQVLTATTDSSGEWSIVLDTSSTSMETLDLGDLYYAPDESGTTDVAVVVFKCPVEDVCD